MDEIFKKGDRAYHYLYKWGTIRNANKSFASIDFDGIGYAMCDVDPLSFTEYTLEGFSQKRPDELPSRGDIVWIKEMDTKMYVPIVFMEAINDDYVLSFNFINIKVVNKDFVLTKNPYAND